MADAKISELPSATIPLGGTELIEIVQGGVNKKAQASDFGGDAPDATDTVPGIMKKYGTTGSNTDGTMDQNSITNAINAAVTGLWDDRGNFDASVNAYPSSGGSGTAGAILKGDVWTVSVAGTLPTAQSVSPGDTVRALVDTPGNTQANWAINSASAGSTVPDASTTTKGKVELATVAEAIAGTDTSRAITSDGLAGRVLKAYNASGTDTYTVTVDGIAAYAAGQIFDISFPNTNTTTATLNVNGLGAKNLYKNYNVPLTSGDLVDNQVYRVYYNGTAFHITNFQMRERVYNVEAYGARHDYQTAYDASVSSGSGTLSTVASRFTSADTGKTIRVFGAGAAGVDLITTITYVSATSVTLANNASTTVSGKQIEWGTDDTLYIRAAIYECFNRGGGTVYLPNGNYILNGALQTSVDGVNPNCQIEIPLSQLSETKRTIKIVGESVVMWPSAPFAAQELPTKGVILRSWIVGSGTIPSVFGASFAFDGFVNGNATVPIFENICVIVKSMQGTTHIAPKMSAFKLYNCGAKQLKNCISMTESDPTESVLPVDETYGFWLSQQGHTDTHSFYENISAANFYYGFRIEEHDAWDKLNAYTCLHAAAVHGINAGAHPIIPSGVINNNWCKYGITFLEGKTVWFEYYAERWPGSFSSKWYDGVADVYVPSTKALYGQIIGKVVNAGGVAGSLIVSGSYTGNLSVRDIVASPTFSYTVDQIKVTSSGSDIIQANGTGGSSSRSGFLATSTSSGGQSTLYLDNNRGSFASYGGVLVGGSANVASNFFGLTRADKFFMFADGASNLGMAVGTLVAQQLVFGTNNTNRMSISGAGSLALERTNTAGGTTGNRTINQMAGSVNFAAGATSITVTNSLVSATSNIFAMVQTNDSTAIIKNVVPGSGSFVINLNAAATAETRVAFWVTN